ncbi:MAG: peptide ABC transporter permease [Alphaproteobacteria bacterium]|nr:peptide ABC transporter permease [Alphaproteobacteria bacterium]HCP01856.1 peptide ABC transporter permease [Rhodospirillaceae bacterium]
MIRTADITCLRRHLGLLVGAVLTGLVILAALVSLFWTPHAFDAVSISQRLQGPSGTHWFGTDHFGRDIASRLMIGARNSIMVGVVAVGIGLVAGVALGLLAAARGGWVDDLVARGADIVFAFPAVVSAILITAVFGPGAVNAIIAIGIFNVPVFARVARGAARQVWNQEYARSGLAIGKSSAAITRDHVLPNIAPVLIVQATIQFAVAILAEAALAYLGLGTQPPSPSWGRMLFDAQTFMALDPKLAILPGLAIFLAVLGLNLLGDGLRDTLDPRLRTERMG